MAAEARAHPEPHSVQRLLERLAGSDGTGDTGDTAQGSAIDLGQPVPAGHYSRVIGAVPFGSVADSRSASAEVRALVRSRRLELLAIAWALLALREGGRLALIVPESVLEGATQAHRALRRRLVEDNALDAVIGLRAGLFKPRTRAAILVATRGGTTERVGFHQLNAARDIPELLARLPGQRDAPALATSFFARREDIRPPHYGLGIERYRPRQPDERRQRPAHEILHEIAGLEVEILQGIRDLVGMLKK